MQTIDQSTPATTLTSHVTQLFTRYRTNRQNTLEAKWRENWKNFYKRKRQPRTVATSQPAEETALDLSVDDLVFDVTKDKALTAWAIVTDLIIRFISGMAIGEVLNSSSPSPRSIIVMIMSPAISPHMPTHIPALWPFSITLFIRRNIAGCVGS